MTDLRIPTHWTPQVAMAVLDLLEALHQAIWNHYEGRIVPLLIADLNASPADESWPDDDEESRP